MQTFETGGAIGDLLRAYGSAAAPANAAVLEGMGMPYRGPITAPRQEGVSSGENFRAMGDPRQQAVGQMIGDPANLAQPVGARLANALKFAKPDAMKMVQELSQGARSQMVERQAGRTFAAPQDEALRLAQERAALPVERGGLGLPPNNTSEQRAQAMGFLNNVYHGTNADIQAMNVAGKGKTAGAGVFVTDNPLVAETYLSGSGEGNILPLLLKKEGLLSVNAKGRNWADIDTNTLAAKAGKKRYSLADMELDKNSATSTDELGIIAKDLLGLKGVEIKNVKDLGPSSHIFRAKEYLKEKYGITPDETWSNVTGNQFAEAKDYMEKLYKSQKNTVTSVQDPDLLRSRFAAFDPFRRNAAIAAAMGVAAPDLLAKEKKK
jgi:hypothetical protein